MPLLISNLLISEHTYVNRKHSKMTTLGKILALATGIGLVACGEGPQTPKEALPNATTAVNATVATGTATVPSVRVVDGKGRGVRGILVHWRVTSGGGRVVNDTIRTNSSGEASSGGWILGTTAGVQTLEATADAIPPATFTANATAGPLAQMTRLSPDIQSAEVNTFVASPPSVRAEDQFGNPIAGVTVQFAASMGSGVLTGEQQSTNASGVATVQSWRLGTSVGQHIVTASAPGISSTVFAATAVAGKPVTLAKVFGDEQQTIANAAVQIRPAVRALDEFGNAVGGVPVTFTVGDSSGTVTGSTVVTELGTGVAVVGGWTTGSAKTQTIKATSSMLPGVSVTFTVHIIESLFNLEVRFVGSGGNSIVRDAFANAALKWRTIITNHSHNSLLNVAQGGCESWIPALNEVVRDVVIYARVTPIDGPGKILGRAGPCYVNPETRLPVMGVMEFDEDDMPNLIANGSLKEVIMHEMGHVLGIGTLWNYYRDLLVGQGSDDPYFRGSSALAQFALINTATYSGNPVPVENQGGAGTRDSHWRESILGRELMTGYISLNVVNPLSRLTVGSLEDIGYVVNMAAADPFSISAQLRYSFPFIQNDVVHLSNDIADIPLYEVHPNGTKRLVSPSVRR